MAEAGRPHIFEDRVERFSRDPRTGGQYSRIGVLAADAESTLINLEGLDEVAQRRGSAIEQDVRKITASGMNGGGISYADSIRRRLAILRPDSDDIFRMQMSFRVNTPDSAREFAVWARRSAARFMVISGGLRQALRPAISTDLGVRDEDFVALHYLGNGAVDETSPLLQPGGKGIVLRGAVESLNGVRDGSLHFMVGDGKNDVEGAKHANEEGVPTVMVGVGDKKVLMEHADIVVASIADAARAIEMVCERAGFTLPKSGQKREPREQGALRLVG